MFYQVYHTTAVVFRSPAFKFYLRSVVNTVRGAVVDLAPLLCKFVLFFIRKRHKGCLLLSLFHRAFCVHLKVELSICYIRSTEVPSYAYVGLRIFFVSRDRARGRGGTLVYFKDDGKFFIVLLVCIVIIMCADGDR